MFSQVALRDKTIADEIVRLGIVPHGIGPCTFLDNAVCTHPDMCMFHLGKGMWVAYHNAFEVLKGFYDIENVKEASCTESAPKSVQSNNKVLKYPHDAGLDCLILGKHLFYGAGADRLIVNKATELGCKLVKCKQGYVKCGICIVGKDACITEDKGLAESLRSCGVDVLLLNEKCVQLHGYNCGFIGGASFKFSHDALAFFGDICGHPEYDSIKGFCANHGAKCVSLSDGVLMDFGGAFCLREK